MTSEAGFGQIANVYDESRGGLERARKFAGQFLEVLDPALPVLDVGAGTGIVTAELAGAGLAVCGVDISPAMLGHARHRLPGRVVAGDATRLPLRDASVPQAITAWVLHCVGDAGRMLAEVARVLRPGGHYYVIPARTAEDHEHEMVRIVTQMNRQLDRAGTRRDDEDRLGALAPAAGLRLAGIRARRTSSQPSSPAAVADHIETGKTSTTWGVTPEQRETIIVPAIAALRALPDAGRERMFEATTYIIEFVKPGT